MAVCIVVSGPPCTGKSTLAARLAARTGWPLLAKDDYKERIFERLGARDRDWSRRVSALAWDLLLAESGRLLAAGGSWLVEGNLREPQRAALAALGRAGLRLLEVRVSAAPAVLLARYRARAACGRRHPGHVDLEALPELERELALPAAAVQGLGGPVIAWDTTGGFDLAALEAELDAALASLSAPARGTRS